MVIWAWLGALLIGVSLGLLGSGGSILTVPVLVYLVGLDPKVAFASSLAIVGLISGVSAIRYAKSNHVDWRNVVWFGVPGMVGAVAGAYVSRYLPAWIQLFIFDVLLLIAAFLMFRPVKHMNELHIPRVFWKIAADGVLVGIITGVVGVGGGFLIVPALVLLGGLPLSVAVGTSLVIITMNSISGFWENLHAMEALHLSLDWGLIVLFSAIGIAGGQVGHKLRSHLPQHLLRQIFAFFLLFMSGYIFWRNLPDLLGAFV